MTLKHFSFELRATNQLSVNYHNPVTFMSKLAQFPVVIISLLAAYGVLFWHLNSEAVTSTTFFRGEYKKLYTLLISLKLIA